MFKFRYMYALLKKEFDNNKIILLLGGRQVGKTSLFKELIRNFKDNFVYIDFDIFENQSIMSSYGEFIKYLEYKGYSRNSKKRFFVFLDEIHAIPKFDKILKNTYDHHSNIKIFATGSSCIEISKNVKDSLAGRKKIFYLYPLNFNEFLLFKNIDIRKNDKRQNFSDLPEKIKNEIRHKLNEFIIFGGYPEVANYSSKKEKIDLIRSIFDLFLRKDIIESMNIRNLYAFENILKYISINLSGLFINNELLSQNNIDIATLKKYLNILEQTFIISRITPFYTNKNKEIVKSPKLFFWDTGCRNYFIKNFNELSERNDSSALIENFIANEILKQLEFETTLHYWRDKNQNEVDFIIENPNNLIAIEVKFKNALKNSDFNGLFKFHNNYKKSSLFLINKIVNKKFNFSENVKILDYLDYLDYKFF